ncbi:ABC transporter permease subunit [Streptomyces sp. NPDC057690]|uniref:ABC transporter permease subunit n=1 Tax=Streptomyces sp. NPDC057690 TaxID=3346214 RepID=UPI003683ADEC
MNSRDRSARVHGVRNARALPKQKPRPHAPPRRYSSQPPTLPHPGRRLRRDRHGGARRLFTGPSAGSSSPDSSFFAGLPRESEELAIVDGCGSPGFFWRIFLPQARPVLFASFVIAFTWTWGDYIAPQLPLSTDRSTLAVAVMTTYVNAAGVPAVNLQGAASVMHVAPILLVFLVAQRGFAAAMATSGPK